MSDFEFSFAIAFTFWEFIWVSLVSLSLPCYLLVVTFHKSLIPRNVNKVSKFFIPFFFFKNTKTKTCGLVNNHPTKTQSSLLFTQINNSFITHAPLVQLNLPTPSLQFPWISAASCIQSTDYRLRPNIEIQQQQSTPGLIWKRSESKNTFILCLKV